MEIDFKGQLAYEQEQKEELQENLEMEIQNLNDQLLSLSNQSHNQIALLKQQLEASEKQLLEKIEALDRMQEAHTVKLDHQQQLNDQER